MTRLLALAALLLAPLSATALVAHDAPSSLLVFPLVRVGTGLDTTIRLTNTGDAPQPVRCVYLDGSLAAGSAAGFTITLDAGRPAVWPASRGATLPGDGGTVPAVPVTPFNGVLRCVAATADGIPTAGDVLIGSAQLDTAPPAASSAAYPATGFSATATSADEPDVLVLGGPQGEYAACPAALALQPFLDGAVIPLGTSDTRATATVIALATCSSSPVGGATATVDLRVTNEFGEQLTARRTLREHLVSDLSRLDTTDPARSIFNSAVAGSPGGHVHIAPTSGSGVLALALTTFTDPDGGAAGRAALPVSLVGERGAPGDLVDLAVPTVTPSPPPPACAGDCNGDGTVAINELITGVNIALGTASVSACPAVDRNADGAVGINELITAVNAALTGC